jgi:hypothetical protein
MGTIAMIEFSFSIDLGKKEGVGPSTESMPVDRGFVAQSLAALAAAFQAGNKDPRGTILDQTGLEVGSWKFALLPFPD